MAHTTAETTAAPTSRCPAERRRSEIVGVAAAACGTWW